MYTLDNLINELRDSKPDASSIKMNVVFLIIKNLGLDFQKLQIEGKMKVAKEEE